MLKEKQIIDNWNTFLSLIEKNITGKRRERLLKFYEAYDQRICLMPASSKTSYHNAFPGGYVQHIINVFDNATVLKGVWEAQGAVIDFSDEEMAFVALNHDLGKFGTLEDELYIDQESKWHKDRGEIYKMNPKLQYMKVQDRSLFLLQQINVKLTENEYMAIKLHDGLYEESNKSYYISFSDDFKLKSNLPYIIHQADLMAARIESNSK